MSLEEQKEAHSVAQKRLAAKLTEQHTADTQALVEGLRSETRRALAHTPTQTDDGHGWSNVKEQYKQAVAKIKGTQLFFYLLASCIL